MTGQPGRAWRTVDATMLCRERVDEAEQQSSNAHGSRRRCWRVTKCPSGWSGYRGVGSGRRRQQAMLTNWRNAPRFPTYPACRIRPLLLLVSHTFDAWDLRELTETRSGRNLTGSRPWDQLLNACQTQCTRAIAPYARYTLWHMSTYSVGTLSSSIFHWLEHWTRMQVHGYASQH